MIVLPQRRSFATKDDFAAAVTLAYEALWQRYLAEPVAQDNPAWHSETGVYSIGLPIVIAREGGAEHAVSNIVKHALDMDKHVINRIARVERNERWIVFF